MPLDKKTLSHISLPENPGWSNTSTQSETSGANSNGVSVKELGRVNLRCRFVLCVEKPNRVVQFLNGIPNKFPREIPCEAYFCLIPWKNLALKISSWNKNARERCSEDDPWRRPQQRRIQFPQSSHAQNLRHILPTSQQRKGDTKGKLSSAMQTPSGNVRQPGPSEGRNRQKSKTDRLRRTTTSCTSLSSRAN